MGSMERSIFFNDGYKGNKVSVAELDVFFWGVIVPIVPIEFGLNGWCQPWKSHISCSFYFLGGKCMKNQDSHLHNSW